MRLHAFRYFFTLILGLALTVNSAPAAPASDTAKTPELSTSLSPADSQTLTDKLDRVRQVLTQEAAPRKANSKDDYKPTGSRDIVLLTFKIMLYIGMLSLLLYFGIKFFKKNVYNRAAGRGVNRSIEVLESAMLGQNKTVSLVKVLDRVLVVGVTEHSVNLLSSIDDEASVRKIMNAKHDDKSGVAGAFSASVNGFLAKFRREETHTATSLHRHLTDEE